MVIHIVDQLCLGRENMAKRNALTDKAKQCESEYTMQIKIHDNLKMAFLSTPLIPPCLQLLTPSHCGYL